MKLNFAQTAAPPFSLDNVDPGMTVAQLKARLAAERSELGGADAAARIRLIFRGQPLADAQVLSEISGLGDDTTVHMLLRAAAQPTPSLDSSASAAATGAAPPGMRATSGTTTTFTTTTTTSGGGGFNPQQIFANLASGQAGFAGAVPPPAGAPGGINVNIAAGGGGAAPDGLPPQFAQLIGGMLNSLGPLMNQLGAPAQQQQQSQQQPVNVAPAPAPAAAPAPPPPQPQPAPQARRASPVRAPPAAEIPRPPQAAPAPTPAPAVAPTASTSTAATAAATHATLAGSNQDAAAPSLPQAMIHVHVTPDQLEELPAKLDRFYARMSASSSAAAPTNDRRVHVEVHEHRNAPAAGGINSAAMANAIGGLMQAVGRFADAIPESSSSSSSDDDANAVQQQRAPAALQLPAGAASVKDRVIQATRETVSAVGVPHFLPLMAGDWSPLGAFHMPVAEALRSPYTARAAAASQPPPHADQIRAAVFSEFIALADASVFKRDADANPLYKALQAETQNTVRTQAERDALFGEIVRIVTKYAGLALDVVLRQPSGGTSARLFGAECRVLAVNASGEIVAVLRSRGLLDDEAIRKVLREVAGAAGPIMQSINPMLAMVVPLQGPVVMLRWAEEAPVTLEQQSAAAAAAPSSTSSSSSAPATQQQQQRPAPPARDAKKKQQEDDLDAFLDDVLDNLDEEEQGGAAPAAASSSSSYSGSNNNSAAIAALRETLSQVPGLPRSSADAIARDAELACNNATAAQQQKK